MDTDNPLWQRLYSLYRATRPLLRDSLSSNLDDGAPSPRQGGKLHLVIAGAPAQIKAELAHAMNQVRSQDGTRSLPMS